MKKKVPPTKEITAQAPEPDDGSMFSLIPKNLKEAMDLAKLIADSDLAPAGFKGKAGNVLIAVQMGAEIGVSPMQAIQNIAVINGKPSIYGDMGKALLLKKGCRIEERDIKEIKAKSEAWCKITRPDGSPPTIRTYSIDNAKEAGLWGKQGPWMTNTYRQMAWRAFWFAARDGAADMLRGLAGVEEVRDYIDVEPEEEKELPPLPQRISEKTQPASPPPQIDEENDSVEDPPPPAETQRQPTINLKAARPMAAKFDAKCKLCGKMILMGTDILYIGDGYDKGRYCVSHAAQ